MFSNTIAGDKWHHWNFNLLGTWSFAPHIYHVYFPGYGVNKKSAWNFILSVLIDVLSHGVIWLFHFSFNLTNSCQVFLYKLYFYVWALDNHLCLLGLTFSVVWLDFTGGFFWCIVKLIRSGLYLWLVVRRLVYKLYFWWCYQRNYWQILKIDCWFAERDNVLLPYSCKYFWQVCESR